jgi:hypothetical protein
LLPRRRIPVMPMPATALLLLLASLQSTTAAAAPNATGAGLAVGKDTSGGSNFELNVFYSLTKTPDCKADPDAQITAAPDECKCLYSLVVCLASVKLGVTGTGSDEKIMAKMYAGGDCSGDPLVGGNTELECNTCNVAQIGSSAGIAVEFICPFSAGGLCEAFGVGIGEPCIAAVACAAVAVLVAACCCCSLYRSRKASRRQPAMYVQYVQAPLLAGSE